MSFKIITTILLVFTSIMIFKIQSFSDASTMQQKPLDNPTKLMFIHHSVGGHWLAHEYGGLVNELNKYGIYVNDITYEWEPAYLSEGIFNKIKRKILALARLDTKGPYNIGDRTDIGHWYEWFAGEHSASIMAAVYAENQETDTFGDHSNANSKSPMKNPGKHFSNEIIMFKSCYPNSLFKGSPEDPPNSTPKPPRNFLPGSEEHTVANAKRIYNDILPYFASHPDKFFVVVNAPPRNDLPQNGEIARGFNNWLYNDWLEENNYKLNNVFVFDFFNVLTSGESWQQNDFGEKSGNHHRIWNGTEQHIIGVDHHVLVYPRDGESDNHPSKSGLNKATHEFVPLLVNRYNKWKSSL